MKKIMFVRQEGEYYCQVCGEGFHELRDCARHMVESHDADTLWAWSIKKHVLEEFLRLAPYSSLTNLFNDKKPLSKEKMLEIGEVH